MVQVFGSHQIETIVCQGLKLPPQRDCLISTILISGLASSQLLISSSSTCLDFGFAERLDSRGLGSVEGYVFWCYLLNNRWKYIVTSAESQECGNWWVRQSSAPAYADEACHSRSSGCVIGPIWKNSDNLNANVMGANWWGVQKPKSINLELLLRNRRSLLILVGIILHFICSHLSHLGIHTI